MFSFPPFSQLRGGDFRRSGVSFPLGGSSDPLRPHSQAAITTGRRERAAVRPRPARERARETSALEGAGKGAPRGACSPKFQPPSTPDTGDQLLPFWEWQEASFPGAGGDSTASCCWRCERPVLPTRPSPGGLGSCAGERQHQQQIFLAQKTCNAAAKGRGGGGGG